MQERKTNKPGVGLWVTTLIWGGTVWLVLTLGAVLYIAPTIRAMASGETAIVALGPLQLFSVTKTIVQQGDGLTLTYSMKPGLVILGLGCVAAEWCLLRLVPRLIVRSSQKSLVHNRGK